MASLPIENWMIWTAFVVITLIALVSSLILNYHWKAYGMNYDRLAKAKKVYFAGIIILLGSASLFAIAITLKGI